MLRVLSVWFLLFSQPAWAGDIQSMEVEYENGVYRLDFDVIIDADLEAVRAIVSDYNQLSRLTDILIESTVLPSPDPDLIRRRMVTRACLLFFCMEAVAVEDVREMGIFILTTIIPEQSDFKSGTTEWQLTESDNGKSRITFHGEQEPAFWLPPVVGPLWLKGKLEREAEKTIERIEALAKGDV